MVLENPPNGEDPFARDSFDESKSAEDDFVIDLSSPQLPQPLVLFRSYAQTRQRLQRNFAREVNGVQQLVGRRLNRPELEAMAYWSNKEIQIQSRGFPAGILAGFYRAYATRSDFRFPFYKPGETFTPDKLQVLGTTLVEGPAARMTWHGIRTLMYAGLAGPVICSFIFTSLAVSTANVGRLRDSRVQEVMQEVIQKAREQQQIARQARMQNPQTVGQGNSTSMQPDGNKSEPNNEYNPAFTPDQPQQDPYSPQSQADLASPTTYGTYATDTSTPYHKSSSNDASYSTPKQRPGNQPPRFDQSQNDRQSSGFFDESYDDASPTAAIPSPSRSSQGSAWDRLRSGSSGPGSGSGPGRSSRANEQQDGSYSRADMESQLSKSSAQKDFDAKIERERQGRNFD